MIAPEILVVRQADEEHPRHSEASIVELTDGGLWLVWQEYLPSELGGSDGAPNRLSALRSDDGGRTWSDHRVLVETPPGDVNVYSPSFLRLPDGDLLLSFMGFHSHRPALSSSWVWRSDDDGASFRPVGQPWRRRSMEMASDTLRRLSNGRLILPVSPPTGLRDEGQNQYLAGAVYSDDDGLTWRESEHWVGLPLRGAMEPHVEELRDGRLLMVLRTQMGAIFRSYSDDGGATWSRPQTTGLRAPESCPELVRIPATGDLLMIWNDSPYDPQHASHYGRRTPLSAAVSRDEGDTWSRSRTIESDPGRAFTNPGCTFTRDGVALITYWTCPYHATGRMNVERLDLRLARIAVDWFYEDGR